MQIRLLKLNMNVCVCVCVYTHTQVRKENSAVTVFMQNAEA